MDLPAITVAVEGEGAPGEDLGEAAAQEVDRLALPGGLLFGRDGLEGGGADGEGVAGAELRANAGGEVGDYGEETVVLRVGAGALGRARRMAAEGVAVARLEEAISLAQEGG